MPNLIIRKGDQKLKEYQAESNIITIGRDEINDIILPEPNISRFHAAVIKNEVGDYFIRDLGSLNGTKLSEQVIYRKFLKEGDFIQVGEYKIEFQKQPTKEEPNRYVPLKKREETNNYPDAQLKTQFKTVHLSVMEYLDNIPKSESEKLFDIRKRLQSLTDPQVINREILEITANYLGARKAYIAFNSPEDELLITQTFGIKENEEIPSLDPKEKRMILDEGQSFAHPILPIAILPIKIGDKLGIIYLERTRHKIFTESEIEIIHFICQCASPVGEIPASELETGNYKWLDKVIGYRKSEKMRDVYDKIDKYANGLFNVLLLGPTGSGKEVVAKSIHDLSSRKNNSFLKLSIPSASPETLIEDALFGHVRNAFTGALSDKPGPFEIAAGGTLFIDEITKVNPAIQSRLLAVLDEKIEENKKIKRKVRRLGANKEIEVDTRVISATNENIEEQVERDEFRDDLYQRLGGRINAINLPSLKERRSDIPLLSHYFIDELNGKIANLTHNTVWLLMRYDWQFNIRELRDVINNLAAKNQEVVFPWHLPETIQKAVEEKIKQGKIDFPEDDPAENQKRLQKLKEVEKEHILATLNKQGWNIKKSAEVLGITRTTLYDKIEQYEFKKS